MSEKEKMVINIPVKKPKDYEEIYESNKEYLPSNINDEDKNKSNDSDEINPEHSSITDRTVDNEDILLAEKEKKETMPRFAIGHKLKNKPMDNSQEDILCYEVVDDNGWEDFRFNSQAYVSKKVLDKGKKLTELMRTTIKTSIVINIEKIPFNFFSIMKELVEKYADEAPKRKKSSCGMFSCSSQKKNLKNICVIFEFKTMGLEFRKHLINFKKQLTSTLSNENKLEFSFNIDFYSALVNEYLEKKTDLLFDFNMDKLKDEVDNYWEYFNVETIINKQVAKLEMQRAKLNSLDEFKMMNDCIICMESERNVIFRPCLHLICCETCGFGKIGTDCPECHTQIQAKQIVLT